MLAVVELTDGDSGVGVDEGLLVDAPDTLEGADVEGVLRAEVAGVLRLDLAVRRLLLLGPLQRLKLVFGEDQALLRDLRRQRLEPLVEGLQVVAQPDAAHAAPGDEQPLLLQLVRGAELPVGGLLEGHLDDGRLNVLLDAVLQNRLPAADLLEGQLAARVVEFLEAVEAVAAVAHHLAGLADAAEGLGQLQEPDLVLDDFLFVRHLTSPPLNIPVQFTGSVRLNRDYYILASRVHSLRDLPAVPVTLDGDALHVGAGRS